MKRKRSPRSGNDLVDWNFRQVIYYLRNKVDVILVTDKYLKNPDDKRETLSGHIYVNHRGRAMIFISGAKNQNSNRDMMGKTLTHEVAHGFLDCYVHEKDILQLEDLLWKSFTREQKRMIISFLPKHKVKRLPNFIDENF